MAQVNDTSSEKLHVPDLHEIDAVILNSLSRLDRQEYEIVRNEKENYIEYRISRTGKYLCTYHAQSGSPGWIVDYSKDPSLRREGADIGYLLIKADLERKFGKTPWLAEDKYPYRVFFHQVLPTTKEHIFDILEDYRLQIVFRDSGLNPGLFHDLEIQKTRSNLNSMLYIFKVARYLDFGIVGKVKVMPINTNEAEVIISNYQLTNHFLDDAVEIYLAGVELLTSLANRLQSLFGKPSALDYLGEKRDRNINRAEIIGSSHPSKTKIRDGPKAQQMENRRKLFMELKTQNPDLTQNQLAEFATDEAYDRVCETLQADNPNWNMIEIDEKAKDVVVNLYGKNKFIVTDVKYAFRDKKWV